MDSETGMYYYGARYYDPRMSLFVSVDPLAEQTMTPYQYVNNNPVNLIDPTGMAPEENDGWIKSLKGGKATYTYDATITSQKQVNEFFGEDSGKEYMGEDFSLFSTTGGKSDGEYRYNFKGTQVTDSSGNNVDLSDNYTTPRGSTIMNPENTTGTFSGFTLGGAVGGGISLTFGFVNDNFGDRGFYFTFGGHSGVGGGAGITSGVISPSVGQTFGINDFEGMGNSININAGIGVVGAGFEYGGTQGNGFSDFGNRTDSNQRPYLYYGGGQSSQHPSIGVRNGKASIGATISSTRTWVFRF